MSKFIICTRNESRINLDRVSYYLPQDAQMKDNIMEYRILFIYDEMIDETWKYVTKESRDKQLVKIDELVTSDKFLTLT